MKSAGLSFLVKLSINLLYLVVFSFFIGLKHNLSYFDLMVLFAFGIYSVFVVTSRQIKI